MMRTSTVTEESNRKDVAPASSFVKETTGIRRLATLVPVIRTTILQIESSGNHENTDW
jgi:hypothetical protein